MASLVFQLTVPMESAPVITAKQHAIVNIQLNIAARTTYPDKFTRDMLLHRLHDVRL